MLASTFRGRDGHVAGAFCRADLETLAATFAGARGKFSLSINDHLCIRECFAAFRTREVETTWTIGSSATRTGRVGELLISNFALD